MKNIENMNALGDMAMAEVAGGEIPDWLLPLLPHDDPTQFQPIDLGDDIGRPLPFPQDRRGNKAPFAVNANPYAPIQKTQDPYNYPITEPIDYPFC